MLTRTPETVMTKLVRRVSGLVFRRSLPPRWIDDTTPQWLAEEMIEPTLGQSLKDVSGAFDDPADG